jgi:hypothetical protein
VPGGFKPWHILQCAYRRNNRPNACMPDANAPDAALEVSVCTFSLPHLPQRPTTSQGISASLRGATVLLQPHARQR